MSPKTKEIIIKVLRAMVWVIYAWVAVTIVLLFLGFLLQLLGADPTAGFVEFVYRSTERAMAPFRGIFESVPLSDNSELDVSILFAIIVYSFVALGLGLALDWVTDKLVAAQHDVRTDAALEARLTAPRPTNSYLLQLSGAEGSTGTAVLSAHGTGTYVDLTVNGLDAAHRYMMWTEDAAGKRASAGTFQPSPVGTTKLGLTSPMKLAEARLFGVSLLGLSDEAVSDVLAARLS
jgi:uncharacterized protein YggT (Ycf19 family)